MGVPKFFRYTSERYPCLNELVKQSQIPDFDNMYLDMNGIIHNCSHPDDSNPHFRITEEKIFADIFHYITILFQIIKPKRLFFMAIDGVAPRAKMNQQRGRRFRSAREAEQLEEKAKAKGETLPTENRFDSNCITPGTVFMARLHAQLRYFVQHKISTDPLWSKCRVILSGHETPGEGEHKIMDYIRWARSQPDYDPGTRHCLYGLDADLIMLGMCTHEPHFALLREEVKFGKSTQRATSPEETNFYLLHLSLMRDYLRQEFIGIKEALPFEYDLEKIVDDWVLMGFLVGNDFIPNLPNMHISNDALPLLYRTYMSVLPTLDGYINEAGTLHLGRFESFMQELAKIDKEAFQETYADLRYFQEKTGRRPNHNERKEYKPNDDDTFNVDIQDIKANKKSDDLQTLINATADMLLDDLDGDDDDEEYEDISDEEANFDMEFVLHKKDYYINKLDYAKVTDEVLRSQAECYVRAIQWNLHYYYRGCASWCWFYPHHYAPYISDIKGFKDLKIEFELGEPFKPFEQLLAVLPAASKSLLPEPFHELMTEEASPIVQYYPVEFDTDLNGKKNDWEAVVLIPFIDESNLLSAMEPCYARLSAEEAQRNTHGPMLVYNYTQESLGEVHSPQYFPPVKECHCRETKVWRTELDVPPAQLRQGVLPGAKTELFYPGFPTMRHLQYKTYIKKNKCKVFDQPSRNDNMIVELIRESPDPELERIGRELLGRIVWVGWPHLVQAKVVSVSNEKQRLHLAVEGPQNGCSDDQGEGEEQNNEASFTVEPNVGNLHKQWLSERATIIEHNLGRMGVELGEITTIVHATNLKGHKYLVKSNTLLAVERVWCAVPCGYAYQAVLRHVKHQIASVTRYATPQEAFPTGSRVFLTTGPYYGCLAQVVSSEDVGRSGRIKVQVTEAEEPSVEASSEGGQAFYRPAHHAAASCGITSQMLSRLTGCVFVILGQKNTAPTEGQHKTNIGLNLKFNKKNQEVSGYTRRCGTTNTWLYSQRCIELVSAYVRKYPELLDMLARTLGNDIFFESELWPGQVGEGKPQEVVEWLKQQPHASAARRDCGSEALEPEEMLRLHRDVHRQLEGSAPLLKDVKLQVKINLVYKPELHEGNLPPDPKADFQLYDRVVCAASNVTVPLGAKGTVTAVYNTKPANTVRLSDKLNSEPSYQVMFDEPFPGAMSEELFDAPTFYRLSGNHLLNISYGRKLRSKAGPAHQHDPYAASSKPNVLRSNDGHHSAFASYSSPTKERQTPDNHYKPIQRPPPPAANMQEQGTELLKSLLKISSPSTNSNATPPENWRTKSTDSAPKPTDQAPNNMRNQQKDNWRSDNNNGSPAAWPQDTNPTKTLDSTLLQNNAKNKQVPGNQPQSKVPQLVPNSNHPALPNQPHPVPPFPNFHNPNQSHAQPSAPRPFPNFHQNQHNFPQNQPTFPQNQPNFTQNQPNFLQNQPNFPRNPPNFPQNPPNFPQNPPNFPQNPPNFPQNQSIFPQHRPNFPQNPPNFPPNQPNFTQKQSNFTQNQPFSQPQMANFAQSQRQTYGQNTGNYDRSESSQQKRNVAIPKHLPAVGGQPLAPPSWNLNTPKQVEPVTPDQLKLSQEGAGNPFVPLQVVAKQRRAQKASTEPPGRRSDDQQPTSNPGGGVPQPALPAPAPVPALPVAHNHQAAAQSGSDSAKPSGRKRKSRIGANLPLL